MIFSMPWHKTNKKLSKIVNMTNFDLIFFIVVFAEPHGEATFILINLLLNIYSWTLCAKY
jgi:hypothetical protein